MPVQVSWYQAHKIVQARYSGVVTMDDFREGTLLILKMFDEVVTSSPGQDSYVVHTLIDNLATEKYDFNMMQMLAFLRQQPEMKEHAGYLAIINPASTSGKVLEMFTSATSQIFNWRMRTFNERAAALKFLYRIDNALLASDKSVRP